MSTAIATPEMLGIKELERYMIEILLVVWSLEAF